MVRIANLVRPETLTGRVFESIGLCMIIYSICVLSIETMPGLSEETAHFLKVSEIVVTIAFTIEYVLRIIASDRKLKYIFSFYGIIDILAILPFYLSMSVDLYALRTIRLFRVFRIFKLARYNKAWIRFGRALAMVKEEAVLFFAITIILLFLSAVGIYYCEHQAQPEHFKSIPHSMWWAVVTLTTVGYGDVYPVTAGGKIFTFMILIVGLGIVAVPAGMVASALAKVRQQEEGEEVSA